MAIHTLIQLDILDILNPVFSHVMFDCVGPYQVKFCSLLLEEKQRWGWHGITNNYSLLYKQPKI